MLQDDIGSATGVFHVYHVMKSYVFYIIALVLAFFLIFFVLPLILIYTQDSQKVDKLYLEAGDKSRLLKGNRSEGSDSNETSSESEKLRPACPLEHFPCDRSRDSRGLIICIHRNLHCNNRTDCPNNEDEEKCSDIPSHVATIVGNIDKRLKANNTILQVYSSPTYHANCLVEAKCHCDLNDTRKVICKNSKVTEIPDNLHISITTLNLDNNQIFNITGETINKYSNLMKLSLRFNAITHLHENVFYNLTKLTHLFLRGNSITYIHPDALRGLQNLRKIYLNHNRLQHLQFSTFANTPHIYFIDLADNKLDVGDQSFPELKTLHWLDLADNKVTRISSKHYHLLRNLNILNLRNNRIRFVDYKAFAQNQDLTDIDLGHNLVFRLHPDTFKGLKSLTELKLDYNQLTDLPPEIFRDLTSLRSLNLTGVTINNIDIHHFVTNTKLDHIYFVKFRYCTYTPKVRNCSPNSDGLSSLDHLLGYPVLRVAVWMVAFVTCVGNFVVIIWRSMSEKEDAILSLFVKNLSVADLLMGIYLAAIGAHDMVFENKYKQHALGWMSSWQCSFLGFLAMLSSELSVLILALITVERYRVIVSASSFRVVTLTNAKVNLTVAWALAFLLAFYPIIHWSRTGERVYYGSNGLCFPLHIDDPFMSGWEYSAAVFLGINFPAVVMILLLYFRMFVTIRHDRKFSRPVQLDRSKQEDAVLALRFFFIVLTDCLCWIPIVVIKLVAFTQISISPTIYAWVVVFVLPINSALNPIIYTLAAPTEIRRRLFENIRNLLQTKCPKICGKRTEGQRVDTAPEWVSSSMYSHVSELTHQTRSSNGSVMSMIVMRAASTGSLPGTGLESFSLTDPKKQIKKGHKNCYQINNF